MLRDVADILGVRASEGWLVGGSVRDRLSGRRSPDIDVVVADDAAAVAEQVAARLHAPWFALSERYPTYRVLGTDGHVDLAEARGDGILDDLAERDFTVNAMAVPVSAWHASGGPDRWGTPGIPGGATVLDPFDGAVHLREKRLVAVSDHIFADDPLRLLRAPRFCHMLGFEPDDALSGMIKAQATRLMDAAVERIMNEVCITLSVGRSVDAVRLWERLGLLGVMLPELAHAGFGSEADRTTRALASMNALDDMMDDPAGWYPEAAGFWKERLCEPVDGAVSRPVALRLAALTAELGVDQVRTVGRRLKLSSAFASLLTAVARCSAISSGSGAQRGPGTITGLLSGSTPVGREAVLYLWEAAPWEPEVVLVAAAEASATWPNTPDGGRSELKGAAQRLMALAVDRARGGSAPLPIDGEALMRELDLESGPALGRALREARLAWESQEVSSRPEVLEVARKAARQG